jgi:hypothetical protein
MSTPIILDRKERDSGMSELWVSMDGERFRLMVATATLNGTTGDLIVKAMALESCRRIKESRSLGKLTIEE